MPRWRRTSRSAVWTSGVVVWRALREGAEGGRADVRLRLLADDARERVERVLEVKRLDGLRRLLDDGGIGVAQARADGDEGTLEEELLHRRQHGDLHRPLVAREELL